MQSDTDTDPVTYSARMEANGRIVIPARVREALGLVAGSELSLTVSGDALVVRSRRATVRRVREQLRQRLRQQPAQAHDAMESGGRQAPNEEVSAFLSERREAERQREERLDRLVRDRSPAE
jgi:AbrB family looped-hinge helix DNA binding protein